MMHASKYLLKLYSPIGYRNPKSLKLYWKLFENKTYNNQIQVDMILKCFWKMRQ